jgi:hypothetical protein
MTPAERMAQLIDSICTEAELRAILGGLTVEQYPATRPATKQPARQPITL